MEILLYIITFLAGWILRAMFEDRTYNITINTDLIDHIIEELRDE